MSNEHEKIIREAAFSLEVEGFDVTDNEKQTALDMLEGRITLEDIITRVLTKGKEYARI